MRDSFFKFTHILLFLVFILTQGKLWLQTLASTQITSFSLTVDDAKMGATTTLRFQSISYSAPFTSTQEFKFSPNIDMTSLLANAKVATSVLWLGW